MKLLRVMTVFILLILMVISEAYTYVKTYQIAYFTCSLLHICYTSVTLVKMLIVRAFRYLLPALLGNIFPSRQF